MVIRQYGSFTENVLDEVSQIRVHQQQFFNYHQINLKSWHYLQ